MADFLTCPPAHRPTCLQVQVWSTGVTLQGWVNDLRAAGCVLAWVPFAVHVHSSTYSAW